MKSESIRATLDVTFESKEGKTFIVLYVEVLKIEQWELKGWAFNE